MNQETFSNPQFETSVLDKVNKLKKGGKLTGNFVLRSELPRKVMC